MSMRKPADGSGPRAVGGQPRGRGALGFAAAGLFAGALPENVTGVAGVTPVTSDVAGRIPHEPGAGPYGADHMFLG